MCRLYTSIFYYYFVYFFFGVTLPGKYIVWNVKTILFGPMILKIKFPFFIKEQTTIFIFCIYNLDCIFYIYNLNRKTHWRRKYLPPENRCMQIELMHSYIQYENGISFSWMSLVWYRSVILKNSTIFSIYTLWYTNQVKRLRSWHSKQFLLYKNLCNFYFK